MTDIATIIKQKPTQRLKEMATAMGAWMGFLNIDQTEASLETLASTIDLIAEQRPEFKAEDMFEAGQMYAAGKLPRVKEKHNVIHPRLVVGIMSAFYADRAAKQARSEPLPAEQQIQYRESTQEKLYRLDRFIDKIVKMWRSHRRVPASDPEMAELWDVFVLMRLNPFTQSELEAIHAEVVEWYNTDVPTDDEYGRLSIPQKRREKYRTQIINYYFKHACIRKMFETGKFWDYYRMEKSYAGN